MFPSARENRCCNVPNALDAVIDKDLQAAVNSLELLKGFYKSKTDKRYERRQSLQHRPDVLAEHRPIVNGQS